MCVLDFLYICIMKANKETALTTREKIKESKWKRGEIRKLLNLNPNKFSVKMKYNDWDDKEISLLKKEGVIE